MNKSFGQADPRLEEYTARTFHPEDALLAEIRERSKAAGLPDIQVAALDGLHLEVLTRLAGAKKIVEVGALGGYSGVSLLRGAGEGGRLWTFELEQKNAEVVRESFQRAGFADRSEVIVGRAAETLPTIVKHAPFDLVFIDADKESYPTYLAWAAEHLRVGGAVIGDNAFLFGEVVDEPDTNPKHANAIRAMRAFHAGLVDPRGRFRSTMIPTGEGMAVGVKIR
jgi:caffeoyl-CoA O-methyltransferase